MVGVDCAGQRHEVVILGVAADGRDYGVSLHPGGTLHIHQEPLRHADRKETCDSRPSRGRLELGEQPWAYRKVVASLDASKDNSSGCPGWSKQGRDQDVHVEDDEHLRCVAPLGAQGTHLFVGQFCSRRPVSRSVPRLTLKYQPPRLSWYTPSGLVGTELPLENRLGAHEVLRATLEDQPTRPISTQK